jgi:hypothetical protein
MVDLNGHEAGNGGHSQGKPTAYRVSSTRRDGGISSTIPASLVASSIWCGVVPAGRLTIFHVSPAPPLHDRHTRLRLESNSHFEDQGDVYSRPLRRA